MRNIQFLVALVAAGCSSGGGGRPVYTPLGDLAMENPGPVDMAMKQQGSPDFSMPEGPPDFSMQQPPPDMTQPPPPDMSMKAYKYGCNGLIGCVNPCPDQACTKACQMQASTSSNNLFNALLTCLFVQACPSSNGGVCDSTSMNYVQANCDSCLMTAQNQGGKCYTPLQNCINDKP